MEVAAAVTGLISVGAKLLATTLQFASKVKDASFFVQNINLDLQSTILFLKRIAAALRKPEELGVFSLEDARLEFRSVLDALEDVLLGMKRLLEKYDEINTSFILRVRWAAFGIEEAARLARILSLHKANLAFTLQLTTG